MVRPGGAGRGRGGDDLGVVRGTGRAGHTGREGRTGRTGGASTTLPVRRRHEIQQLTLHALLPTKERRGRVCEDVAHQISMRANIYRYTRDMRA